MEIEEVKATSWSLSEFESVESVLNETENKVNLIFNEKIKLQQMQKDLKAKLKQADNKINNIKKKSNVEIKAVLANVFFSAIPVKGDVDFDKIQSIIDYIQKKEIDFNSVKTSIKELKKSNSDLEQVLQKNDYEELEEDEGIELNF